MATTGLWPVKCRLKDVLDYADNPDKTTAQKYLDRDLYATLTYAGNDEKTDKQIYVDAINCPKQRAYQAMMAVKRRFGKLGGNVAYHGYQSFQTGEVTPEEALAIGRETAYRMWGDKYQVLVTVHLNTDNLHCHFVVNSVSFKDGSKFGNHQKDHIKLREISDQVCREYGKSVLKDTSFWQGQSRGAYWYKKQGGMTHRDMLKYDIEYVLPTCGSIKDFRYQMEALGYTFGRTDEYYAHTTITAPGWKRPIRLDSLGYSREVLDERINANWDKGVEFYAVLSQRIQKWRTTALEDEVSRLEFTIEHSYDTVTVLVDTLFLILITVLQMAEDLVSPDEGKIALSVGVELSFLPEQFQYDVLEICDMNDCTPSYSQSWHLHQFYKDGVLDKYLIFKTLSEEKANQRETVKVPMDRLRDIVPESYTVKQTEDFLIKAAEYYHRNIIRQRNRDSR